MGWNAFAIFWTTLLVYLELTRHWNAHCSQLHFTHKPTDEILESHKNLPDSNFSNCGRSGNVTRILMSACALAPCHFASGQQFDLEYDFLPARDFPHLDLRLSLIDGDTRESYLLGFYGGKLEVKANVTVTSFTIVTLNAAFPLDKTGYLEISREYEGESEICARFELVVEAGGTSPTHPTIPTTTTTTESEGETTTLPPGEFFCEDTGYFPDPISCSEYHMCQLFPNGTLWDTVFNCSVTTVWCQESLTCEHPTVCPCPLFSSKQSPRNTFVL